VTVRLTGLTWDHPRGYRVLDALAGSLEPDVSVYWQRQPLEGFESRPLRTLADDYDLLVVDHGRCRWTPPPRSRWPGQT
jgi:multiple sugar transport system substrate-binding protein